MNKAFEKILEMLEELHERYINQYGAVGGNPMAFSVKECMEIVQEVAEEYNGGWIPCSERLPEEKQDVLVCFDKVDGLTIAWYDTYLRIWRNSSTDYTCKAEPIAWQPLPEPYK